MKAEYIQKGDNLNYTNPTDETISAGTVIIIGDICTVAATDIPAGELGSVATKGVWEMSKDNAEITAGAKVYYNETDDVVTATASVTTGSGNDEVTTSNSFVGIAILDATADETEVNVRLNG